MADLYNNAYERAQASFANLMRGQPGAAARGAFALPTLSPTERKKILEDYMDNKPGPLKFLLNMATSPLIVAGLILTLKYKIPQAGKLLNWENKVANYAKRMAPGMRFIGDFQATFKGTPLPALMERITKTKHAFMSKWVNEQAGVHLERYAKMGGKLTKESGARISAYMEGLDSVDNPAWKILAGYGNKHLKTQLKLPKIQLNKADQYLADELSSVYEGMRIEYLGGGGKVSLGATQRAFERMGINIPKEFITKGKYFPHTETMTKELLKKRYDEWQALLLRGGKNLDEKLTGVPGADPSGGIFQATMGKSPGKKATLREAPRRHGMLPEEGDLKAAGLWTDDVRDAYATMEATILQNAAMGAKAGTSTLRRYTLDPLKAFENYARGGASHLAWTTPPTGATKGVGERIMEELAILTNPNSGGYNIQKATMLRETYIPMLAGQQSRTQMQASVSFSHSKEWAADKLKGMNIPKSTKDFMMKGLVGPSSPSWAQIGSEIQMYMYQTTMGFNPLSPAKNLLQSLITTVPSIGPKYFGKGIRELTNRSGAYLKDLKKGMAKRDAFHNNFYEFAESGFDIRHVPGLEEIEAARYGFKHMTGIRKAKKSLEEAALWMFTKSERANRIVAFYGARAKALQELPGTKWTDPFREVTGVLKRGTVQLERAANMYGTTITGMTQYGGGALNTPYGMLSSGFLNWGPIRQFTQFPLRTLGFATGHALQHGGVAGRMLLTSGLAYEAGKELLDSDISNALIFGALPELGENRAFAPLPLVSPFLQTMGSVGNAIVKGDLEELKKAAPVVLPFGVMGARVGTVLAPKFSELMGRPYVDYEGEQDGRYPVMTRDGRLIGNYSPLQLFGRAIGLGDITTTKERALAGYLLRQKDQIRDYRKRFLEAAIMENDSEKAQRIQDEYERAYPNTGGMHFRKSDIQSMLLRKEIPRLEQILEGLPPDAREEFAAIIATALGASGPGFLGSDPSLMGRGTIKSRRTGAQGGASGQMQGMPGPLQSAIGPQGQAAGKFRDMGVQRRDELASRGFQGFDTY